MPYYETCNWRIGVSEEELSRGYFMFVGLPIHLKIRYRDHTQKVPQGSGWTARHGYENLEINWQVLTKSQAIYLRTKIQEALDTTGYVYLTVTRADGRDGWIDVRGAPHMPDIEAADHSTSGIHHNNVSLFVNDVTIVNDPAVF